MKITIITASYNSEKTIRNTIESVLCQSYVNYEYIIIDGASKDHTVSIIKEYEPKFQGKLKWISEHDNGIYNAINKGINISTGDVIGILNSDDFFSSTRVLEKIHTSFKADSIDAVYGDVHYVNHSNLSKPIRYYSSANFKPSMMRMGFMPAHPSFYVKSYCYKKFGTYAENYKIAADFELLLRFIFVHKINILYLPFDFVTMRIGGVSTSGINSHITIVKEHLKGLRDNNVYSNFILLSLRYFSKIVNLIIFRISKKNNLVDN